MEPNTVAPPARNYYKLAAIPFLLSHVLVLGALWSGVTWQAVICCFVLTVTGLLGVMAGYHRYFSHRTFKTSRVFQFVLAVLAQMTAQKGVLWWASHHRMHHKYSDQPGDSHSPIVDGFFYAHIGWILDDTEETKWDGIQDFAKYPELRWLNTYWSVPPTLLGTAVFLLLGWPGLFIGFFLSTVLVWHATFLVNSATHLWGKRRYNTSDSSRNSWLLALFTFGEGWHNNHHYYQSSCRNGFYWWEIDITYYAIKMLGWLGIVWDIREPPAHVLEEARKPKASDAEPQALVVET
jgi:stearoyl-CoA desaturase (delta-9 desaturase)